MSRDPIDRRVFLQVGAGLAGGLVIGFDLRNTGGLLPPLLAAPGPPTMVSGPTLAFRPSAWLRIGADDRIVFVLDKSEMGQGVMTSLPTILAEELEVDPAVFTIETAPADRAYVNTDLGLQMTGGSSSVASTYTSLREAGAVARQLLIAAAAKTWGVPEAQCHAAAGEVLHAASGKRARYGALATMAAEMPATEPRLKDPKDFKLIGRSGARLDNLAKVTGRAGFGIDVQIPDLRVAVVKRPPSFGAKAAKLDAVAVASVKAMPGVEDVLEIATGVAIVARRYWQARAAADALAVEWAPGPAAGLSSAGIFADYARLAAAKLEKLVDGDVEKALSTATTVIAAEYQLPFVAHATMEPGNCTAVVTADGCDIWAPTQSPGLAQQLAVEMTGLPYDKVRIHTTFLGGGFGRRLYQDYVVEAVELAMRTKKPVKVQWSREDDMQHDFYRPASVHMLKGGIDKNGRVVAWAQGIAAQSILVQCVPEWLRAMMPTWMPEGLKGFSGRTAGGALALFGQDQTTAEGADDLPYDVGHLEVGYELTESPIPVGFWRSVGHSYTGFVVESFVDELAHAAGKDPLEFRLGLLGGSRGSPRHYAVLELAAAKAGWTTPPPAGVFRGLAMHASFGSYVAQVAEVRVGKDGAIKVERVVCAVDCGQAINPDLVAAQMQSAIIFGLSAALFGEITIRDGVVEQSNFHDFLVARITDAPLIEVHIVPSANVPKGVGEPGLPPLAPAVANAVFAATGRRLRQLPLRLT